MVGYEPDLNPFVDWAKELRELMEVLEKDKAEVETVLKKDKMKDEKEFPETSDAPLLKPCIRPCQTQKVAVTREVVDEGYLDRLATPLIQVLSVSISSDFSDGKPCEIYGSIRAIEGPDCGFLLYDRDPEDSETISKEDTLSLVGPDGGAIIPSLTTSLDLFLKDRTRGVEVVKGTLYFDSLAEDSYDRLLKRDVSGAHGVAHVYYVVFKFAAYATVQVKVTKTDDSNNKYNAASIYGSIVARYEDGRKYCSTDEEVKFLETRLFNNPSQQPLLVMVDAPIKLSRNAVVAPVYSSLVIELNLWNSTGKIAGDCLSFPAHYPGDNFLNIQTQEACVEVKVRWCHAYLYLYKQRKIEDSHRIESDKVGAGVQKKPRVSHDQHLSACVIPRNTVLTMGNSSYCGRSKVEVYSVFVCGITEKISALCGTIIVDDGSDKFSIYNRDESCYELLPDHSLASIEVNYRAIQNNEFYIILKLWDPVSKLGVSKGELSWNVATLEMNMSWYDKQLCSVVRGDDGYAAVHYEIFDRAFEALLEIKLFGNVPPDIPIRLYGTLIARYSSHDYSTSYQKKYYTNRLFDLPRDRLVELKTGSRIEMLKSIVVVPTRSSLIIEANLRGSAIENVDEPICGMEEFQIDLCDSVSRIISGGNYWIEVNVKYQK